MSKAVQPYTYQQQKDVDELDRVGMDLQCLFTRRIANADLRVALKQKLAELIHMAKAGVVQ